MANVRFCGLDLNKSYGLTIRVQADAPPGALRSSSSGFRKNFLEQSQRLGYGSLVVLISKETKQPSLVNFAILTTCEVIAFSRIN